MTSKENLKLPKPRLICMTGADGSGKTTLASSVAESLKSRGYKVRYVHGILMRKHFLRPVKPIAQKLFMKGTDERRDYVHYMKVKTSASRRHPVMSAIYGAIWFLDYFFEAFTRVTLPIWKGEVVVADRYIYDLVLNVSLTTARPFERNSWLLAWFFLINPRPDLVFVVDTPEEIALSRKSDIHSIEYLRERRYEYLTIAKRYGFQVLDGQEKPGVLVEKVLSQALPEKQA